MRCPRSPSALLQQYLSRRVSLLHFAIALILSTVPLLAAAQTGKPAPPSRSKAQASKPPAAQLPPGLQARISALASAKQSSDPSSVSTASRSVAALALRDIGETQVRQGSAQAALDAYRRSLDFEDAPDTHVGLALAYAAARQTDNALSEITNAVVADPQSARAWLAQGKIWMLKGNYERAVESFTRSNQLRPDADASYFLASALLHTNQDAQAKALFQKLLNGSKRPAVLHFAFAEAYDETNHFEDAASELKTAIALEPRTTRAHYRLGLVLMTRAQGELTPEVRAEFAKEVQINPHGFFGNYALALTHFHDQQYEAAEKYLAMASAADPVSPDSWLFRGLAAFTRGDRANAEEYLDKAIALTGSDQSRNHYQIRRAYYALSRILTDPEKKLEAVARFRDLQNKSLMEIPQGNTMGGGMAQMEAALSALVGLAEEEQRAFSRSLTDSRSPLTLQAEDRAQEELSQTRLHQVLAAALNDLGAAEARTQQFELALAHFHEAERWNPDTPGLMRNVGMSAARLSDYAEAARALRPVVAADPKDSIARSVLGTALFSTQAYTEAAQTFAPLGDSVLAQPDLAYSWAASLVRINKYPEASALLDKLEKQKLPADTLIVIAQTWSQMGNYPRTVQVCRKAIELNPRVPRAHFIAGVALIHQNDPAQAAQEFRQELQVNPESTEAQFHLAFALLQQSQTAEAVTWLKKVLALDPNHPEANYEYGRVLMTDGKPADAIPYLEAAARLKPQFEPVHYQLQSAYRAVGRKEDADREAKIFREMKARSRNITLPPPRAEEPSPPHSD